MEYPIRILNMFTIMNRGGAETMVMNYYRNIDRSKVQFDFLVHRDEQGAYDEEIESLGGKIYHMIPIYPQNFRKYRKMAGEFFDAHPEYRIIHSHMSELGYFAFQEAEKRGVPVRICHAHNAPHGWDIKMIMRNYFKKAMMPYLTHLFVCGRESGLWLFGKENESRFIYLNNAVDAGLFRLQPSVGEQVRQELGLKDNFIVGHVGRFDEQKNHEFLLDIFMKLEASHPQAVLLLIGDGKLRQRIEEKAEALKVKGKIHFLGTRTDINRLMQCMDVFLFPSLFEGLPLTMVEAQAAGNLCVISEEIPAECIITDNVRRISLRKTAEEWAQEVWEEASSYQKQDTYELIGERRFDVKKNAQELEEFYINAYR